MLGRGVLCRPDLPRLIAGATVCGDTVEPFSWAQILQLLRRFFALTLQHYDAVCAGNPLKQWLVYLRGYYPQAALLFEQVKRLRLPDDINLALTDAASAREPRYCAA
jgi:tRNA-dihydrouridine synthase C